jgi:hypothetical protein
MGEPPMRSLRAVRVGSTRHAEGGAVVTTPEPGPGREERVTEEMVARAIWARAIWARAEALDTAAADYAGHDGIPAGSRFAAMRAALTAVADDLARAGEERAQRTCAEELRAWADEHTGRQDFVDHYDNRDYIDRYASHGELHRLADRWAAPDREVPDGG